MFGKFMNSYYYGKAGKGDYTPEDLPKNRWQLFMEMLRVRLSGLCRMNVIYVLPWLPAMLVIGSLLMNTITTLNAPYNMAAAYENVIEAQTTGVGLGADGSVTIVLDAEKNETMTYTKEQVDQIIEFESLEDGEVAMMQVEAMRGQLMTSLLWLIPCIFITGPWTAGVAYVTRNWARDEHAFVWSDMKDAMKTNWKEALGLSVISSVLPIIMYLCWNFYGDMAADNWIMVIPQTLVVMVAILWAISVTYAFPMLVTYKMNFKTILRNSILLAIGRLPMSVGIRLLHCVPAAIAVALLLFVGSLYIPLILFAYYLIFGWAFSRFITASYTNAAFDKFINHRIEGVQVNRGMAEEEEWDDDDDDEEEQERELKPWENGYTDR